MQLGALVAAGHAPGDIMDWTWDQIREGALAVRAYHTDLAVSLWTGKSPTLVAARKEATRHQALQMMARDLANHRPDLSPEDLRRLVEEEFAGIPADERELIVCGNATRVWNL